MAKRKSLSVRTRFEVFKRDLFTCQYCGRNPPTVILEVDHIVPVASGGDESQANLITACWDCNRGKADKSLDQVPISLARQQEEMQERAKQVEAYGKFLMAQRKKKVDAAIRVGTYYCDQYAAPRDVGGFRLAGAREQSIRTFLGRMPEALILEAIDITFAKFPSFDGNEDRRAWKYFCGVCWGMIKEAEGDG